MWSKRFEKGSESAKKGVIPAECGPEELGKLLNVTTSSLRNLAREGVIPKPQRGLYQVFGSVQGYMNMLRKEEKDDSYTTARARMTSAKADVTELQRGRLLGELIPANEVLAAVCTGQLKLIAAALRGLIGGCILTGQECPLFEEKQPPMLQCGNFGF